MLESRAEVVVRAIVWEVLKVPNTLHFLFTKERKNIFYGFMEFFLEVHMASKLKALNLHLRLITIFLPILKFNKKINVPY